MKIRHLFFAMMAAASVLVSCEEKEENLGAPEITLDPATLEFGETGGADNAQTLTVTSTRDWTIEQDEKYDWVTVSPSEGQASSEPQTVTVTVTDNTQSDRTATIRFTATNGTVYKDLTVRQTGPEATVYTTLAEVREMAPADPNTSESVTLGDDVRVKVTVVSNHDVLQNLTSGANVYVQDETAGIMIRFSGSAKELNTFGKQLEIDLSGQKIGYYQTAMQINNVPLENAVLLNDGEVIDVEPKSISVQDLIDNTYESQYVAVQNVQVAEKDLGKNFVEGDSYTSITFEDAEGNDFVVFSTNYSDALKDTKVPEGSGVLEGIASINKSNPQIILTQLSDMDGLTGARFEGTEPDPVSGSIADVINAEEDTPATTEGVVAGIYKSGMVITDGTDNLLVYNGQSNFVAPDVKIGDKVSVSGTRASYGELPQLKASYDDIKVISSGNAVEYPEPIVVTGANISSFDKSVCSYFQYTGTLSVSGNYYNVAIDGTSVQGSLSYPLDELNLSEYEGVEATYEGYYCGGNNDKYLNMLVVKVSSSGETPEPEPGEPVKATVAEFLAAPVSSTQYYILTGTISNIVNTTYGNFTLTDETGSVYVHGLTKEQLESNDKSFSSLGLKEGDIVTICGTRDEYNGDAQVGGPAYYISHEAGEEPEPDPDSPFTSNVTWTLGNKAYTQKANINGGGPYDVLKLGTTDVIGDATITIPAGTKSVEFYAVAWKGTTATLSFEIAGTQFGTQEVKGNDGASGNPTYTITVTDDDHYVVNSPMAAPTEMEVKVTTAGKGRVILWGIKAITE